MDFFSDTVSAVKQQIKEDRTSLYVFLFLLVAGLAIAIYAMYDHYTYLNKITGIKKNVQISVVEKHFEKVRVYW